MTDGGLPENFHADWQGGTLRVRLPEPVTTTSSTYDPVLTRKDARQISAWVAARERGLSTHPDLHRGEVAVEKIVLVRSPLFTDRSAQEFRTRLKDALSADGIGVTVAIVAEGVREAAAPAPSGTDDGWGGETKEVDLEIPDDDLGFGEPPPPPPPPPPSAPSPSGDVEAPKEKKPFKAPIPARHRQRDEKRSEPSSSSDFELE